MRRVKALLIGSLAMAWLVAGVVPATAADPKGTLAIVNGVPGAKVDVCLNGTEIRSGVAYGGKILLAIVKTGSKTIRFYSKDPRKCKGSLLGQKQFSLPAGRDLTIVVTKRSPKVLVFDNANLGEIPPLGVLSISTTYAVRHAADLAADLSYTQWPATSLPFNLSPSSIFSKGQESRQPNPSSGFFPESIIEVKAIPFGSSKVVRAPLVKTVVSHRLEWILVGSKASNARWVVIDRAMSLPSP